MNARRTLCAIAASTALVLVLGCEHEESTAPAPVTPGVTNMQGPDVESAVVDELAKAGCDREQRCFESGPPGRRFATRDECMGNLRQMMANDLSTYDCAKGFSREGLDHCTSTIFNEQCIHPLDTLSRKDACRPRSICIQ